LAYQFIFLLHSIQCPTITGLLTTYWRAITKHCRDPQHLTKPLPWSFKDVYDDLVSSDVHLLQLLPLPFRLQLAVSPNIHQINNQIPHCHLNQQQLVFIVLGSQIFIPQQYAFSCSSSNMLTMFQ
jgi:hypothetical protein